MPPELSVVVPAHNSASFLPRLLERLQAQTLEPERFEVVVVDDGSRDDSAAVVAAYRAGHPALCVRWYWQERALGGAARNRGIAEARAPIVLFLDSDMLALPELVESHLRAHREHPEPEVAVLGRVTTGDGDIELVSPDGDGGAAPGSTLRQLNPISFASGNVSLKKAWVESAGLFLPGLPCLQDVELALRLAERGLVLLYCPEACSLHARPLDTVDKVIASGRKYGRTLAEWYDRVPRFRLWRARLGGRFSGGWRQLRERPRQFVRDGIVRLLVTRVTVGALERFARRLPHTAPPGRLRVRCCIELWAFHYRNEFRVRRRELRRETTPCLDAGAGSAVAPHACAQPAANAIAHAQGGPA